ncbi:MAG: nucleoside-diphosphate kinase [Candidatus Parvarchaeota archaeon]|nr:nucleoside-diphosphate kinase [Candidatus Jingweiarchaeum tengchongense]MCW1300282.1 nucleoside-diphosphate kinase [Candidatus Jingweiarchaeum tengchongense]MCW1304482.1 nucleoside-diphosphate kinase [Candidatus Jingweiarchaeum tengchongense]MCW1305788.1 nucleoside-diphosphate kinase [Candidatus Jingweiarchaeum tengchongense]MCW1309902.1 nucleoside-diphosphate kinase [Candidatus Jingweiarchaeum tengchongense]
MGKEEEIRKSGMIERTLVLLKPDAVERGLSGEIIKRFEQRGLKIIGLKMVVPKREFVEKHYEAHRGKSFFKPLVEFLTNKPVVAMVIEGIHAIEIVRKMVGPTQPSEAPPGTIRGDFSHVSGAYADKFQFVVKNLIHASGNKEEAEKEIALWFKPEELCEYKRVEDVHIFGW